METFFNISPPPSPLPPSLPPSLPRCSVAPFRPAAASLEPIASFSTQSNSLFSNYNIRLVNVSLGPIKIVIPSNGGVTPPIANTTAMRGFSQVLFLAEHQFSLG